MHLDIDSYVFDRVAGAVEQIISKRRGELTQFTRLTDDLALGRFGRMKLAISLEETFDLELENDDVERFVVVGDIVKHISHRYFRDAEAAFAT